MKKTWSRLYFRMELLVAVSRVEENSEMAVDPDSEVEKVAVAVPPKPSHDNPPQLSTKTRENAFVA